MKFCQIIGRPLTIAKDALRAARETRSVVSSLDYQISKLLGDGGARSHRGGNGLVARFAAGLLLSRVEKRPITAVTAQYWPRDYQLNKAATGSAMTGQAGWAAELVNVVVTDVSDRLLLPSVFSQLRAQGLQYVYSGDSVTKVPSVAGTPSGAFVGEGAPIPAGSLLVTLLSMPPRKAASIIAVTKEVLAGSAASIETSLTAILSEDLSIMVDNLLLDAVAGDAIRPPGQRFGVSGLTPAASGTPTDKISADIRALVGGIAPALRPVLIVAGPQAASLSVVAPGLPTITAPYLAAGTVIAVDAADSLRSSVPSTS